MRSQPGERPNVSGTTLFVLVIAAVVLVVLAARAVARRRRKTPEPELDPVVLRARALVAVRDLAVENGGAFIPAHKVVRRLGQSPGLPIALETLLHEGLTERGHAADGWSGDRPTAVGYEEAAKLDAESR